MKFQELNAFEKISTNLDILKNLFDLLDIGGQLSFANVTQQLQFVYRSFIWQDINYKKVKIKKYSDTIRLKSANKYLHYDLSCEEYDYFLNIFGREVEELNEGHGQALNISLHLTNLTSIEYSYLLITKRQIQSIAVMCPKLENLFINGCCNKRHEILRLAVDIDVCSLLAMATLKSFSLKTGLNYKIKYAFVEDLTKKIKWPVNSSSCIERLDIYLSTMATRFLSLFAQLQILTVTVFYNVNNEDIVALSHACKKLKELTFHFTSFKNIEDFSLLQSLKDLSFYHCEGLTYDNLRNILTGTQLMTFTSIGTNYDGLFHYYFLAPTLKSIYIDAIKSFDFQSETGFYRSRK